MVTQKEIKENNRNGTNTRKRWGTSKIVYKGPVSDNNHTNKTQQNAPRKKTPTITQIPKSPLSH